MANGVCWGDDQSADSGVMGLMGWLTGYIGVGTSRPTVKWWGNGLADSWVMGLMGQPTGYVGVITSQLTVGW